jgi:hypothetical protein
MGSCRFCQVQTNHNLKFTLITCITTVDENLMCKDFEEFWKLISEILCGKAHPIEKYLHLIGFFWSWFDFGKNKGTCVVRFKCEPPI